MRIWINRKHASVNFQADTPEEEKQLDALLGFTFKPRPLSEKPFKSVEDGEPIAGEIGGHERQRWISIDLPMVLRETEG